MSEAVLVALARPVVETRFQLLVAAPCLLPRVRQRRLGRDIGVVLPKQPILIRFGGCHQSANTPNSAPLAPTH